MGDLVQLKHHKLLGWSKARELNTTTCISKRALGWSRGWSQEHIKRAQSPKQCKIGPRLLWRT